MNIINVKYRNGLKMFIEIEEQQQLQLTEGLSQGSKARICKRVSYAKLPQL